MNEVLNGALNKAEETAKRDLPPFLIGPEITPDMKLADGMGYDEFKERMTKITKFQIDKIKSMAGSTPEADKFADYLEKWLTNDMGIKEAFYSLYMERPQEDVKKGE